MSQSFNLLIDFEATGVETETARITEIGAQLVDGEFNVHKEFSQLVYAEDYPPLSQEVQDVTGLTDAKLKAEGIPPMEAFQRLATWLESTEVQYICAYNSDYDENLFRAEVRRHTLSFIPLINYLAQVPWVCSMKDLKANSKCKSWKMAHVALDHGVAVDPKKLHRAVNDVDLMRQMLKELKVSMTEMYAYRTSPWAYLQAVIPGPWLDGGKGKTEAQKLGYSWERARGDDRVWEKTWVKRCKADAVDAEIGSAPFKVKRLE
jgi:DNA polymerase III epsilon subunit-like protein